MRRRGICGAPWSRLLGGRVRCCPRAGRRDGGGLSIAYPLAGRHPRLPLPLGGAVAAGDRGGIPLRGFTKGEAKPPPLELNYIKPSPSRACEVTNPPWCGRGRGAGGWVPQNFPGRRDQGVGLSKLLTLQARQRRPPAQGLATKKRAGALFTALRAGMTMLLPSIYRGCAAL